MGIIKSQIGQYRTLQVYIRGVDWTPPDPKQVRLDMKNLLSWYTKNKNKIHPVVSAVYFHVGFETIHPFIDGNGRVGRLLLNFILHKNNYPMANIPLADRNTYYKVLEQAQMDGDLGPILGFIVELMRDNRIVL